jgi:hypothetical protein
MNKKLMFAILLICTLSTTVLAAKNCNAPAYSSTKNYVAGE